jgi:hypothetical protein
VRQSYAESIRNWKLNITKPVLTQLQELEVWYITGHKQNKSALNGLIKGRPNKYTKGDLVCYRDFALIPHKKTKIKFVSAPFEVLYAIGPTVFLLHGDLKISTVYIYFEEPLYLPQLLFVYFNLSHSPSTGTELMFGHIIY